MQLIHGDCLEEMAKMPDKSVDLVLTDPPYGTTACKWDSVIPFEPMWKQLNRIIKDKSAIVLFGSEPFSSALRMSNIKNYKYDWIWEKEQGTGFARAKKQPLRKHEIISVFYMKQPYYNYLGEALPKEKKIRRKVNSNNKSNSDCLSKAEKRTSVYTHKTKHTILKFNRQRGKHPTQKPVALLEYLIKTYTNENETVLDFTFGSGSTAIACLNTSRNFIGIEKDETYFQVAKGRIENHQVQREIF